MHLENQTASGPRRRRRYADEYKAKLVAHCLQPHVSIASIALAHGLNANLLRRWVEEHKRSRLVAPIDGSLQPPTSRERPTAFIELQPALQADADHQRQAQVAPITIELPFSKGPVRLHWPAEHADRLAVCLKVLLT